MRETNMPGDFVDVRAKRRWRVVVTVSLLSMLAVGPLVLNFVEKVRDASDRAH
jgi:hypothetical protein